MFSLSLSPPPPLSFSVSIGQALQRGGMQASWTGLQNQRRRSHYIIALPVRLFKIKRSLGAQTEVKGTKWLRNTKDLYIQQRKLIIHNNNNNNYNNNTPQNI